MPSINFKKSNFSHKFNYFYCYIAAAVAIDRLRPSEKFLNVMNTDNATKLLKYLLDFVGYKKIDY